MARARSPSEPTDHHFMNDLRRQYKRGLARKAKEEPEPEQKLISKSSLPRYGDPLVTPDGLTVFPEREITPQDETTPVTVEGPPPEDFRPKSARVLRDLSAPTKAMTGVAIVYAYTMLGVSDAEICDSLLMTKDQVEHVRGHRAYAELFDAVLSELVNTNSAFLRGRIASYAHVAVDKVGFLAKNSKKEDIALRASQDILNRSGVRPEDLAKSQHDQHTEFRIVIEGRKGDSKVSINGHDIDRNMDFGAKDGEQIEG